MTPILGCVLFTAGCQATYSGTGDRSTYSIGALARRTVGGRKVDGYYLLHLQLTR